MRAMLDSNIADKVDADPEAAALVKKLTAAGKLTTSVTAMQLEEVGRIPPGRRPAEKLAAISHAEVVDEAAFLLDVSHLDRARFGSDAEHDIIDAVVGAGSREKRAADGLIAATASKECDVLVHRRRDALQHSTV